MTENNKDLQLPSWTSEFDIEKAKYVDDEIITIIASSNIMFFTPPCPPQGGNRVRRTHQSNVSPRTRIPPLRGARGVFP